MTDITPDTKEPAATLLATILLNKPSGVAWDEVASLLLADMQLKSDRSTNLLSEAQLQKLPCYTPLETGASGLVVLSKDLSIKRKLVIESAYNEHEFMVHVAGEVSQEQLDVLLQPKVHVSISTNKDGVTGLRFALKAYRAGDIADNCARAGLDVQAMKRLRIGRMPVAKMEAGQWRYLMGYERF